jgi:catechol 2,3-dioxygenase-like lactoylglutathione lyase family enzyme
MTPHGVLETAVYADDLAAAERFYTEVLGLTLITRDPARHVFFRSGESVFLVFNPDATSREGATPHGARGSGHAAFRIREAELQVWRERLRECGVEIEQEIAWPQGGHSLYFRDPAGNCMELATPKLWGLPEP